MLNNLITSRTRIKLLKKFFLNSSTSAHLRGLEAEFGESTNAIRIELNRFERAGLLISRWEKNRKLYRANTGHPLFSDIHKIVLKETGIDRVVENIIHRIGNLISVYLTGDFACGNDGQIIELIIVGNKIDRDYLEKKAIQAGNMVGRKVNYTLVDPENEKEYLLKYNPEELLPLWRNDTGIE